MKSQIIAMGGGGFTMEPHNMLLDDYIVNQLNNVMPKILFLPTASNDHPNLIITFYRCFKKYNASLNHLTIKDFSTKNIRSLLLDQDLIYVSGGHTTYMLDIWKEYDVVSILKECLEKGVLLAGVSSGAVCWFKEGITDSNPPLSKEKCLHFLDGSYCAHYENPGRRPTFHQAIMENSIVSGYGVENGVALHFINGKLYDTISSNKKNLAYYVTKQEDRVSETQLKPKYLGDIRV